MLTQLETQQPPQQPPLPPRELTADYRYQSQSLPLTVDVDRTSSSSSGSMMLSPLQPAASYSNNSPLTGSPNASTVPYVAVQDGGDDTAKAAPRLSGGGSAALPAGVNRFTQLSFDDKGNLVCQVLPMSTGPMAFGIWAHHLALSTAFLCLLFGPFAIIWWLHDTSPLYSNRLSLAAGVYSIALGPLIVFEERRGLPVGFLGSFFDTAVSRYNVRSVGYIVLSALLYFSWPTVIPAISLCIVAVINRAACAMGERFEYLSQRPASRRARSNKESKKVSMCMRVYSVFQPLLVIFKTIRDSNRVGIVVWLVIYAAGNIVLFVLTELTWIDKVNTTRQLYLDTAPDKVLSYWITPAKAFGLVLDLNCALILLPVCRTLIKGLYEQSTVDQHWTTKTLRFALKIVPLDFALQFHKLIGMVILLAAVGHTLAHFVNFALAETVTLNVLSGPWPLISGGLLIGVMLLMYSSTSERLRFAKFELFFETHHLFIVFFVLLLVHGAHGKGPNFWKYFIGPAFLYVCERLLRIYRGRLPVQVLSAQFMQDVMCLEFAKAGVFARPYRTGQYLQLQCPAVSPLQWHPFTISSAPSDPTVTVHIKISTDKPSSFTYRVAAYMISLRRIAAPVENADDEKRASDVALADRMPLGMTRRQAADSGYEYITLDRPDKIQPTLRLPGRSVGPDGRPLFRIDGPHPAPAQHLSEYKISLVVGAGIGSTPLSSCLRQVVQHDWATVREESKYRPSVAYFIMLLPHDKIPSFRWLVQLIRETQQKVNELKAAGRMNDKRFEVHIYVTSPPSKKQQEADCEVILQDMERSRKAAAGRPSLGSNQLRRMSGTGVPSSSGAMLTLDDYLLALLMTKPRVSTKDPAAKWSGTVAPVSSTADSHIVTINGDVQPSAASTVTSPATATAASHRLDDVHVYSGRPDFRQIFDALHARHIKRRVGVMFCGAPIIANDLREQCKAQNARSDAGGTRFQMHAENF